jgi:hypothetical protein
MRVIMPNRIFTIHNHRLLVLIAALPQGVMGANDTELRASCVREGEKEALSVRKSGEWKETTLGMGNVRTHSKGSHPTALEAGTSPIFFPLRVFGSQFFAHIPHKKRNKLAVRLSTSNFLNCCCRREPTGCHTSKGCGSAVSTVRGISA